MSKSCGCDKTIDLSASGGGGVVSAHATSHYAAGSDPIDHNQLLNGSGNQHIDWTASTANFDNTGTLTNKNDVRIQNDSNTAFRVSNLAGTSDILTIDTSGITRSALLGECVITNPDNAATDTLLVEDDLLNEMFRVDGANNFTQISNSFIYTGNTPANNTFLKSDVAGNITNALITSIDHDTLTGFVADEHVNYVNGLATEAVITSGNIRGGQIQIGTADNYLDPQAGFGFDVYSEEGAGAVLTASITPSLITAQSPILSNDYHHINITDTSAFRVRNALFADKFNIDTTNSRVEIPSTLRYTGSTPTANYILRTDINGDLSYVNETSINHDTLTGFVANEHIDHSAVSITPQNGLTGGGDITASRTIDPVYGTLANTICQGNDARLSDARTPTSHATSHESGGSDQIDHNSLLNAGGNQHIDWTNATANFLTTGNITLSGTTGALLVGTAGAVANLDTVSGVNQFSGLRTEVVSTQLNGFLVKTAIRDCFNVDLRAGIEKITMDADTETNGDARVLSGSATAFRVSDASGTTDFLTMDLSGSGVTTHTATQNIITPQVNSSNTLLVNNSVGTKLFSAGVGRVDITQTLRYTGDTPINNGFLRVDTNGDVFVSAPPATAEAYVTGSTAATSNVGLPKPLEFTAATQTLGVNSPSGDWAIITTGNRCALQYTGSKTGILHSGATISVSGGNGQEYDFQMYKNGVAVAGSKVFLTTSNAVPTTSTAIHSVMNMTTNDYIEVYLIVATDANCVAEEVNIFGVLMG